MAEMPAERLSNPLMHRMRAVLQPLWALTILPIGTRLADMVGRLAAVRIVRVVAGLIALMALASGLLWLGDNRASRRVVVTPGATVDYVRIAQSTAVPVRVGGWTGATLWVAPEPSPADLQERAVTGPTTAHFTIDRQGRASASLAWLQQAPIAGANLQIHLVGDWQGQWPTQEQARAVVALLRLVHRQSGESSDFELMLGQGVVSAPTEAPLAWLSCVQANLDAQ